ncbi:exosome complex component RRP4 [Haematococcus lacustris]|uniref:Exosome complex component RRP4 n=1 Tax=Haematococcus lacustris TaxID=44745 RepID=A0A6A0A7A6_HAELA|nr:exosome complex component RRP4 [Haematococcus lacustris]
MGFCGRQQLEAVVRVGNAIRALARCYLPIYATTIMDAYELAVERGGGLADMGQPDFLAALVRSEALRRRAAQAR